jgi:hypothetical protein
MKFVREGHEADAWCVVAFVSRGMLVRALLPMWYGFAALDW